MKKILGYFFLLILSFSFAFGDIISPEKFKEEISKENRVVVDLRTPEEIEKSGKIKEAQEKNFFDSDFKNWVQNLDKDKTYLIYCASGVRSNMAEKIFQENGLKVHQLEGGYGNWKWKENTPLREKILGKFKGKPTLIVIAGTYCPHCQKEVPEIDKKIYQKYKDKINLFLNTVDYLKGNRFPYSLPQGFDRRIADYYFLTEGKECGYIPTWVLLDKDLRPVLSSCGGSLSIDELDKAISYLVQGKKIDKKIQKNKKEIKNNKGNKNIWIILIIGLVVLGWSFLGKIKNSNK